MRDPPSHVGGVALDTATNRSGIAQSVLDIANGYGYVTRFDGNDNLFGQGRVYKWALNGSSAPTLASYVDMHHQRRLLPRGSHQAGQRPALLFQRSFRIRRTCIATGCRPGRMRRWKPEISACFPRRTHRCRPGEQIPRATAIGAKSSRGASRLRDPPSADFGLHWPRLRRRTTPALY